MTRKLFLFMLAACTMLALGSCKNDKRSNSDDADNDKSIEQTDDDEEDADDDSVDEAPERGDFTFSTDVHVMDEDDFHYVDSIIVYMRTENGLKLTDGCTPMPLDPDQWTGFGEIEEKDINFDGYPDLQVCLGPQNSYGNFTYAAWVWDQEGHKFVRVKEYEEICDPVLHPDDGTVTGGFRMDDHEDNVVYRWDTKFSLVLESSDTFVYSELDDDE